MNQSPGAIPLQIYLLGLVDLRDVLALQRRIVYETGEGNGASLLLCEHPPTISVGRSGSRAHIAADDETLRALGIRSHWVNRGGGCVLHLPGQLAVYPIVPLDRLGFTVCGYLKKLHQVLICLLHEFDLHGSVRTDLPGVFLGEARVASVGVAVSRWIAYHGFTLNVGPYLDQFNLLSEPGIAWAPLKQTSMESRRQRCAPMPRVREAVIRNLEQVLGFKSHHVYTGHPLIRRKVLSHVYAPAPG